MIRRSTVASLILSAGISLMAVLPSSAASLKPAMRVVPGKVAIRSHLTVVASHLQPNSIVTVLLAVPNLQKRRVAEFLGSGRTSPNGSVRMTVNIPIVTTCGAASLYLVNPQTSQMVRAAFRLTGCKASGKGSAPPPPPSPHKP